MTTNTIIIHNKATMKATGIHTKCNNKPVICIDNGNRYASVTDAAKAAGVHPVTMSCHLHGKTSRCADLRWSFMAHVTENADAILDELSKANAKLAAQESEMAEYRAWKLEQEKIRKAKEIHQQLIAKANARIERYLRAEQVARERYELMMSKRVEAEEKLAALQANA